MEEVRDDHREREPAAVVLPRHLEQLFLRAVAELGLPEPCRPLREHGSVASDIGVPRGDLGRGASGDPVVDLAGAVGDPAGGGGPELDTADGRVVPEEAIAAARHEERDAHLRVALHEVEHDALLVQPAVGVLAQAEEALALIGGEALLDLLVTVPGGGEVARAWPPEVDGLLGEQFFAAIALHEADMTGSVHFCGERTNGDVRALRADLYGRFRRRPLGQGTVALGQVVEASAHAQAVRAPGFDAYHFVPGAPGERAGVPSNTHLGLVVGLQEKRGHGGPFQLTVLPLRVDRSPSGQGPVRMSELRSPQALPAACSLQPAACGRCGPVRAGAAHRPAGGPALPAEGGRLGCGCSGGRAAAPMGTVRTRRGTASVLPSPRLRLC